MRKYLLVVGGIFLFVSLLVFGDGDAKFASLSACSTLEICPPGLSNSSPQLPALMEGARLEIAYGVVFSVISIILLLFGIFGSSAATVSKKRAQARPVNT